MEKQVSKEPNSAQMIDARAAKLFDYRYPITKSSHWTALIGYPRTALQLRSKQAPAEPITSEHFVIDIRLSEIIKFI